MNLLQIILLVVSSVLAMGFIVIRTVKGGVIAFLFKTLASFGFVTSAVIGLIECGYCLNARWVMGLLVIGLILGMLGDIILDLKVVYSDDKHYLNTGMLCFGLGHIAYFSAFTMYALELNTDMLMPLLIAGGSALILTIGITLSSKNMGLKFGNFLWQTVGYTFILSFMTVYTLVLAILLGGAMWVAFVGLLLFFASDIVLSFQYFGGKLDSKLLIVVNHTLYYLAQIILVATLFML